MKLSDVIIKPLITEKATGKAQIEVYTFVIHNQAGKAQIKTVLESIYKVKVKSVNITHRRGKTRNSPERTAPLRRSRVSVAGGIERAKKLFCDS